MENKTKSGPEILREFFMNMEKLEGVDPQVAQVVKRLHEDGNLTNVNIANELQRLREEPASGKR